MNLWKLILFAGAFGLSVRILMTLMVNHRIVYRNELLAKIAEKEARKAEAQKELEATQEIPVEQMNQPKAA